VAVGLASAIVLLDALPGALADGETRGVWARLRRAVGMRGAKNDVKPPNGTRTDRPPHKKDYSYLPYGYPPYETSSWSSDGRHSLGQSREAFLKPCHC
jgi:hypothetical protein